MLNNRFFPALGTLMLVGMVACNGADDRQVAQDTAVTTVPRQDTIAVERTVEVETDTVIDTRP